MGISVIGGSSSTGGSYSFILDLANSSNDVFDLGQDYPAGGYAIDVASGDTSFDIYLLDAAGLEVGYSRSTTIISSTPFSKVVILGITDLTDKLTFSFTGAAITSSEKGTATGAAPYVTSISPTDLPFIDDSTAVTGGNFATDVAVTFESGATSIAAKSITRTDSQNLIVVRPDALDAALDPWSLTVANPGVTAPTGSNAHKAQVTAGATPTWVTTSPLPGAIAGNAYTATLVATDADGAVTYSIASGSLPGGLALDANTGVISGTPTSAGTTFIARVTDAGGNVNDREFSIAVQLGQGGTVVQYNGKTYHIFYSTATFTAAGDIPSADVLVIGGGAGGGSVGGTNGGAGGGGAGGLAYSAGISILSGNYTATVGAGGAVGTNGVGSSLGTLVDAYGGGYGGSNSGQNGQNGGSGGGASSDRGSSYYGGLPITAGEGYRGGENPANSYYGSSGGGGAGQIGVGGQFNTGGKGGDGLLFADFATAASRVFNGGYFAGGGGGGAINSDGTIGQGGVGGGGAGGRGGAQIHSIAGLTNSGGGGGGGAYTGGTYGNSAAGGSGMVIVRY